ncbi:MAG: glycosyltransferase family 4 protein [Patescibacteria group bacterium]
MRIVLITSKLRFEENGAPIGGSVVDLHLKAKGLAELGHEVTVVTAFSEMNRLFSPLPYRVAERRIYGRGLMALQRGVYALLKEFEESADVFYIDGHMFLYGGGAYRAFGGVKPVVAFFNVRLNLWADVSMKVVRLSLFRRLKKLARYALERFVGVPLTRHLDAFVFNTPQLMRLYHDFGFAKGRTEAVIEDFVDTAMLSERYCVTPERIEAKQRERGAVRILATGRMIPEKGFELVIRALARLPRKERYSLTLSGGGPEKARLENLVQTLGLQSQVSFPGWIPAAELRELFARSHVFVFPKWWLEYGSAVLTEAMAFGLPLVVPQGGALEWLSGRAALAFPCDDADALARQIEALGEDAPLRIALAKRALARAAALDARLLAKRLETVLRSCARVGYR